MELLSAVLAQEVPANPWEWVFYGGGVGSLALVTWLLGTGRLVPRSVVLDERARVDAEMTRIQAEIDVRDATIDRLIAERNRYIDLALRSASAAERTTEAVADVERVARDAAAEALRRAGD